MCNSAKDCWYIWCLGECERLPVPVPDLPAGELLQPPWRVTVCWWHRREIVICYLDYQYLIWKQISTIYTYLNLIWVTKNRIKYCIFCIHFPHFCIWKALCGHLRSPGSGSSTDLHLPSMHHFQFSAIKCILISDTWVYQRIQPQFIHKSCSNIY